MYNNINVDFCPKGGVSAVSKTNGKVFVIIPTLCPILPGLPELTHAVCDRGYTLLVVDDAGKSAQTPAPEGIDERAVIVRHDGPAGRGAAIRAGLARIREMTADKPVPHIGEPSPDVIAVMGARDLYEVTDLDRVIARAKEPHNEFRLTLGVRVFNGRYSFMTRIGNGITHLIFHALVGAHVSDTLTGLRAFSASMLSNMLTLEGDTADYEMNMLTWFARHGAGFCEVPMEGMPHRAAHNRHLIADSVQVYKGLLLFAGSSFISFLCEYILFCLLCPLLTNRNPGIGDGVANVLARTVGCVVNYLLNCRFVFRRKPTWRNAGQFTLLAVSLMVLDTLLLYLWRLTPLHFMLCKLLTEMSMFVINYVVQNKVIFRKKKTPRG